VLPYIARRLVGTLLLVVVVAALTLVLVSLAPGDTAVTLAGGAAGDPEYLADLRNRLGLDHSLAHQIGAYVSAVARGDLGFSAVQGRPVADVIAARVPATLLLAGSALAISSLSGVVLGVRAASRSGTRGDAVISLGSIASYSVPPFWLGQLLIALLAVRLRWLPAGGMRSVGGMSGLPGVLDVARHLVLPAVTLSLPLLGLTLRTTRSSAMAVLGAPYVTAARARGVRERAVLFKHVLRNALRPVVTVVSHQLGFVLTGAILVEVIFSWPGLGRLLLSSVLNRDTPTLVGLLLALSAAVAVVNLVADVVNSALDPRVRYR